MILRFCQDQPFPSQRFFPVTVACVSLRQSGGQELLAMQGVSPSEETCLQRAHTHNSSPPTSVKMRPLARSLLCCICCLSGLLRIAVYDMTLLDVAYSAAEVCCQIPAAILAAYVTATDPEQKENQAATQMLTYRRSGKQAGRRPTSQRRRLQPETVTKDQKARQTSE